MLIAGPNLTIDRTLTIDELRPGEVLRFERVAVTPGGKGVNVARVARALGAAAAARRASCRAAPAPPAAALIADEGVDVRGVDRSAASCARPRSSWSAAGASTVINEPGPALGARRLGALRGGGRRRGWRGTRVLVVRGSAAAGRAAGRLRAAGRARAGRAARWRSSTSAGAQLGAALAAGPTS